MNLKIKLIHFLIPLAVFFSCSESDSSQGDKFYNNNQFEEAVDAYSKVLVNSPKNVNALYNRGRSHEELGNLDEAESDMKAAFSVDPKNVQVLMGLSNLYQKKKSYEMALQYASYATEVSGAPAMAFLLKGRAYHLLGNTENAMTEYNTAIKMNDEFGQAYYYRGMLKQATNRTRAACADFKLAVALDHQPANEASEKYCQ